MNHLNLLTVILRSYIVNYPVILEWGGHIRTLIAFVLDDWSYVDRFISFLDPKAIVIPDADGVPAMRKVLQNSNSRGFFVKIGNPGKMTQKMYEKIDVARAVIEDGKIDGQTVKSAGFILLNKSVPKNLCDISVCIRISKEMIENAVILLDSVVPNLQDFSYIKSEIEKRQYDDDIIDGLYAATAFILPKLKANNMSDDYEKYIDVLEQLPELFIDANDNEQIVDMAVEELFNYVIEKMKVYKLPQLDEQAISNLNSAGYVARSRLYISNQLFMEIFEKTIATTSVDIVKAALCDAGFLIRERNSYVKKMRYIDASGCSQKKRMLLFDMTKVQCSEGIRLDEYISVRLN